MGVDVERLGVLAGHLAQLTHRLDQLHPLLRGGRLLRKLKRRLEEPERLLAEPVLPGPGPGPHGVGVGPVIDSGLRVVVRQVECQLVLLLGIELFQRQRDPPVVLAPLLNRQPVGHCRLKDPARQDERRLALDGEAVQQPQCLQLLDRVEKHLLVQAQHRAQELQCERPRCCGPDLQYSQFLGREVFQPSLHHVGYRVRRAVGLQRVRGQRPAGAPHQENLAFDQRIDRLDDEQRVPAGGPHQPVHQHFAARHLSDQR